MKLLTILSLWVTLWSCTNREQNENQHHFGSHQHEGHGHPRAFEVTTIHDSLMLKMGEVMTISEAIIDRISQLDTIAEDNQYQKVWFRDSRKHLAELNDAEEAMMSWMHQFNSDTLDQIPVEAGDRYLAMQKSNILVVKYKMESSIRKAREFLNQ